MIKHEAHLIFCVDNGVTLYLTKEKTWSPDVAEAELMSEGEASNTCGEFDGGCGSITLWSEPIRF